jgi:uncharacterized membrane protein YfcA
MPEISVLIAGMLITGIAGGILAGLLGVGGGIVIVPVLEGVLELLGVDASVRMHIAVATSLAVIVPTSISSSRAHFKRGAVDTELAKHWLPFIFIGAVTGTVIASHVDGHVLTAVFAVVALLVAVKMVLPLENWTLASGVPRGTGILLMPTTIGMVSTMMGIGGGTLSVSALTLLSEPIHRAIGTAALFGLLISIPGTLGFMWSGYGNDLLPPGSLGYVNLIGFAFIAPATVLAAPLGARMAHALSRRQLSVIFGCFMFIASLRMLLRTLEV